MITFAVEGMTCGHCVQAITEAVRQLDPNARVEVDLAGHRVSISAASESPADYAEAISDSGYTVTSSSISNDPGPT